MVNDIASARGIVALDVATLEDALALVATLGSAVQRYKVGLELFTAEGPVALAALNEAGKSVFLDLKLHDIPHTVAGAARAAADHGADLFTVHAAGGRAMIEAAAQAAPRTRVVAVTALTSLDPRNLPAHIRTDRPLGEWVLDLTEEALAGGAAGVVLSGAEVAQVKKRFGADCLCVVPGVRPAGSALHDQARTATPADALAAGADYLVIGRAVTQDADPLAAWTQLWSDVSLQEGRR